jgi:cytochrome c peroxidase
MTCRVLTLAIAASILPFFTCEANAAMPFAFVGSFFNTAPTPPPAPAPEVIPDANLDDDKFDLTGAPGPLSDVPVPMPPDLSKYVRDINKARLLGKALFWDMQVGGDGRTACATCHFHAGVDSRPRNTLSPKGPGTPVNNTFHGANYTLVAEDFPFHKFVDNTNRKSAVSRTTSEVVGSQGVVRKDFVRINAGNPVDTGNDVPDPVFNVKGVNTRQVTGRNAPSVINAVFNDRQFWDGRANRFFNGVNPFGDTDPNAFVYRTVNGFPTKTRILIDNGSLASQAVGPPNNSVEMSWNGRTFPLLGRKMLSLRPLALQKVDPTDSVLGPFADGNKGLKSSVTYASLIKEAFQPEWWNATQPYTGSMVFQNGYWTKNPININGSFTQMEANFSLFWGLAIQLYESTLISDQTDYDRFIKGDTAAISDVAKQGLEIFLHQGKCINCHKGSEFAHGTVSQTRPIGKNQIELIERMIMGDGKQAVYDAGFYNIGVTPTQEDVAVGADGPFGPFSLSRRRQLGQDIKDPTTVGASERLAIKGSFKTPSLRNIALTGPYFHNGGKLRLEEVVEFYARGGDFHERNIADLDPDIEVIDDVVGNKERIRAVVEFMRTLTDHRVEFQKAPFDHPELIIPNGHSGFKNGVALDNNVVLPATGVNGGARLKTFQEILMDGIPK